MTELSPFLVSAVSDDGWLAGSTMLANRTNQSLKEVPVTIEALTQEFLLDVGAFDALAAAAWVANVDVSPENGGVGGSPAPDTNRYAVRGIANEGGPTRNLFQWLAPSDTYNVERIDFGRGSNSLLFGDSEPGGQGNVYTKRAVIGRTFGNALAQAGAFDSYRFNLDYNRSLNDRAAFRLNLTRSHSERDFDFNAFDFAGLHGAVTHRPFKHTIVRLEGEVGRYRRNWGTNRETMLERRTPGLGFNNVWTVLPNNAVVQNTSLAALDRQAAPAGATFSLLDTDRGGFPRHYNWGGPDQTDDRAFTTVSAYIEQKLGPVTLELSYNQQISSWVRNQLQGPYLIRSDVNGRRFITYSFQDRHELNKVRTPRVMATYQWEPARCMSQLLVFSAELREGRFGTAIYGDKNDLHNGALNTDASTIFYRIYVDDPGGYDSVLRERDRRRDTLPETSTFRRVRFLGSARGEGSWARAYGLSASGRYFDGRLMSMFGVRLDTNDTSNTNPWTAANRTARGEIVYPGSYDEHPERYELQAARSGVEEMTENAGLVYPLTRNINLYTVYSTSFRAANGSAINFAGDVIDQQRGKTFEVGFKSDFFNRKLVWNLNWYDLTRSNVEFQYDMLGLTEDQLEDLFNPNGLSSLAPDYIDVSGRREERMQYSRGYEATLIYYPGRGWNIRLSGAYKKVTQDRSMLRFKELLAAAVGRGNENAAYIAAANDIVALNGLDGREVAARYAAPFSGNFAVNYRFDRAGPLEGISFGLNGSYLGDYVLNYIDSREIRGGRVLALHGTAGYQRRVWNRPTTFRLNVRNLLESERITTGVVKLTDGSLRRIHDYAEPRTWMLTATVGF